MRFSIMRISSILMLSLWMSFFPTKANAELIDKIVAQVGSQIVTLHDVQKFAPAIVRSINDMEAGDERNTAWEAYYNEAIEQVIYDKTLEIAAARVGVSATNEEVEEMIVVLQEQNTQFRAQVLAILEREGVVTPELFLFVKQIIIKNKLSGMLVSRAIVTESDIIAYLREQRPDFQAEQVEYNVDIVFFPDDDSLEIAIDALDDGSSLELAAEAAGQSMIAMGWTRPEQLASADMQSELLNLQDGSTSKGINDGSGRYLVMRRNEMRRSINIPEAERNSITYTLREQQLNAIFMNWLEKQKQSIVVNRYAVN
ncbi:MAG: hypothetical protein LBV04_00525 [Deferribacteraceae bacterium]|nr:hypothetical protein [Deferribacteraceae bacterium]